MRNHRRALISTLLLTGALAATAAAQSGRAGEWPQWRGPGRTGISAEKGLLKSWPAGGPRLLWKAENLGGGYSSLSVTQGKVFSMGFRGEDEAVWALDEKTGRGLWATPIGRANRDVGYGDGPRSTPTVDGDRLYVVGVSGDVACLRVANGQLLWKKSLVTEFGGRIPPWGYSESPLVDGDRVIATPGGRAATLVALNKMTGDVVWRASVPQGDMAAYASSIAADVNGERQYIQFLHGGVVGVSAKDGRFLWRYNSPANGTANCSTPVYRDGHVFAASAYNTGGGLARLAPGPSGTTAQEVYFTRSMKNHHGGMVLVGDHLYGFDESNLTCLDWKTGKVMWSDRSVGKGSVIYADGSLYCRGERGGVALVEATPTAYAEKGRFDQPERSGKNAWSHPVVANGRLYLRDQEALFCYDVRGAGQ